MKAQDQKEELRNAGVFIVDGIEFIRKDALLGWIKDQLKENAEWREVNPDDRFFGGKEVAFERIIDKINSL